MVKRIEVTSATRKRGPFQKETGCRKNRQPEAACIVKFKMARCGIVRDRSLGRILLEFIRQPDLGATREAAGEFAAASEAIQSSADERPSGSFNAFATVGVVHQGFVVLLQTDENEWL